VDAKLLAWGQAAAARRTRIPLASDRYPPTAGCHAPASGRRPLSTNRYALGSNHHSLGSNRHPPACPGDLIQRAAARHRHVPPLWLFTDSGRLPDPLASVARLPRGLAGVVFRHDNHPNRTSLGRELARICRARRLVLVVAGDVRLAAALRAGVHLRGGRWPRPVRTKGFVTSSAHDFPDLRRASRAGARVAFLSPVFATASHPDARCLGPARWSRMARGLTMAVAALGGIDGMSVRRLPRLCRGVGAIGALA
jgi:thiamine-phosphate pyrophosphorylase